MRIELPLFPYVAAALAVVAAGVATAEPLQCPRPYDPAERVVRHRIPQGRVPLPEIAGVSARPPVTPTLRGSIRRVDVTDGRKLVALTFDLCESSGEVAGYDGGVIAALRRDGVKATLFAGGHWVATHPARFSELLADPLFEIGNHSWDHANLRGLSPERTGVEIRAPAAIMETTRAAGLCQASDRRPAGLFRFPFGACDAAAMTAVNDAGYLAIQWDVSTGDPSPAQSARAILRETLAGVRPGSIVLAHANGRGWHTADALPQLINELKKRGYEFVTVSELLAAGTPVIVPSCYDSHPGDTARYDRFRIGGAASRRPATP